MFTEIYELERFTAVVLRLPQISLKLEAEFLESAVECFDDESS